MAGFFTSLKMLYDLVMGVKALIALVQANKDEEWFKNSNVVMAKLREAKTEDEYKKLAKDLRDLWSGAK